MKVIFFCLFLMFISDSVSSEVYQWVDENGNSHFSDKNTDGDARVINIEPIEVIETQKIKSKNKSPGKKNIGKDSIYAINVREANPEYGTKIPIELCENQNPTPCIMSTKIMIQPVTNFKNIKKNLTHSAWLALKKNSVLGQETWEFNLCHQEWSENIPCFAVDGYVVIKHYRPIFYAFFKK